MTPRINIADLPDAGEGRNWVSRHEGQAAVLIRTPRVGEPEYVLGSVETIVRQDTVWRAMVLRNRWIWKKLGADKRTPDAAARALLRYLDKARPDKGGKDEAK